MASYSPNIFPLKPKGIITTKKRKKSKARKGFWVVILSQVNVEYTSRDGSSLRNVRVG